MSLAAGLVGLVLLRDKWVQHRWRLAARRLRMQFIAGSPFEGDRILGCQGPYRLELDNRQRKHTSVVLHTDHVPPNLHICARTWNYPVADDPVCIGDPNFDRSVRVCGPIDELQARLTQPAREVLTDILGEPTSSTASVVITGGRITYDAEYHVETARRLEDVIQHLRAIADALALCRPITAQLRTNACDPREPIAVRLNNLRALMTIHRDATDTSMACRTLLTDSEPWLRLTAAQHRLHLQDGQHTLRALIQDRAVPDDLRVLAIRATDDPTLGSLLASGCYRASGGDQLLQPALSTPPRDPLEGLLCDIVRDPSSAVRRAVAQSLAARAHTEPHLLLRLAEDPSAEVASTAIQGLARVFEPAPPTLEPVLIRALGRRSYAVRLAAVAALAIVGQRSAIEPLRAVLRTAFFDQRLRHAARSAMRAIQVRTYVGEGGHLSLVVDHDVRGGLSESAAGAVSEAPTPVRG